MNHAHKDFGYICNLESIQLFVMQQAKYHCPKCGNTQSEVDEIRTTGKGFSRFFDIQNKKFTVVTCTRCKYSEFYKGTPSSLGNIADFLVG